MISERCSLGLSDEELSRWRDDDLSPARMALIRAHIDACATCRERVAAFEKIGAGLRGLEPPPLDLARLLADVRATTSSVTATSTSTPVKLPDSAQHRSRRMVTGAAGLAAVLVVSLLAAYIFAMYGPLRPAGNTNPSGVLPIPLDAMPLQATVISMSSRTDGWAFGSKSNNGDTPVIALHYTAGKWTRVQTVVKGRINALKMLSTSDGWLVGSNVYHYDGHSWRAVTISQQVAYDEYEQIAAVSPSAIWITGRVDKPFILHYDGSAWARQDLPSLQALHLGNYSLAGISMTSADDGWAIGTNYFSPTNYKDPAVNDMRPLGVLLHYTGGVWKIVKTYPAYELQTISMASATDGWIGGNYWTDFKHNADGSSSAVNKPVLWRLTDGVWKDAPLPNTQGDGSLLGMVWSIQMLSPTKGWMRAGIFRAADANGPSGLPQQPNEFIPMYQLRDGQWVEAPMPTSFPSPYNADVFAFVSSDEFWAMGGWGLSHYIHGEWKNVVA